MNGPQIKGCPRRAGEYSYDSDEEAHYPKWDPHFLTVDEKLTKEWQFVKDFEGRTFCSLPALRSLYDHQICSTGKIARFLWVDYGPSPRWIVST